MRHLYDILERKVDFYKKTLFCSKTVIFLLAILFIIVVHPMFSNGVILNDEIQYRMAGMKGVESFTSFLWREAVNDGRVLAFLPLLFSSYLNFLLPFSIYMGFVRVVLVMVNIIVFGVFLNKIFRNVAFSLFTSIIVLVTIPTTFEHNEPNAFCMFIVGFIMLLCSFLCYISYLEHKKKRALSICVGLLFVALCHYEVFIMFTPIYLFLAVRHTDCKQRTVKNITKKILLPFCTSGAYLLLYICFSILFPSEYAGNQLAFVSFDSTMRIVVQLTLSSIPGYYLFNAKYAYLYLIHSKHQTSGIDAQNLISSLVKDSFFSVRVVVIFIVLSMLLIYIFRYKPISQKNKKKDCIWTVLAGISCIILPTVPNSLSLSYQGAVNSTDLIALPVSYFMHFASVFVLCFVGWAIIDHLKSKKVLLLLSVLIALFCIPIQTMNEVFSGVHENNFSKLTSTESMLRTQTAKTIIDDQRVSASDIYRTRNTLAIHNGYWSEFAHFVGLEADIRNEPFEENPVNIYYQNDQFFVLSIGIHRMVLSPKPLTLPQAIRINDSEYLYVDFSNPNNYHPPAMDNGFFLYCFEIDNGKLSPSMFPQAIKNESSIGNTLTTAYIQHGYYSDGWVTTESRFQLMSGSEGYLTINGYYPEKITPELTGTVLVNGELAGTFCIEESVFSFILSVPKNQIISIEIINDFLLPRKGEDKRELSFILSELTTS